MWKRTTSLEKVIFLKQKLETFTNNLGDFSPAEVGNGISRTPEFSKDP
jgi:hypothetical protein